MKRKFFFTLAAGVILIACTKETGSFQSNGLF